MQDRAWWQELARWALWLMAMALVMAWVARARLKRRPIGSPRRLAHPKSTLIIGLVVFGLFAGIAILSNVYRNNTTTWWTTAVFVGFALMALVMVADYVFARHEITDDGLNYGRFTGSRGHLRWSDLRSVEYAQGMKWFRLKTQAGQTARISAMLTGLPEFARAVLENAPPGAIDASTRSLLEATADGRPPPVW